MNLEFKVAEWIPNAVEDETPRSIEFISGAGDNFLAAIIVLGLFFAGRVPLAAVSAAPLLFYFAFFFFEQVRRYKQIAAAKG